MIAVVGDLLLDIFMLQSLVRAEQTEGLLLRPGGSAANTAAWLAHMGACVTFVGCVGQDPCGEMLVRNLEAHRVQAHVRIVENVETGAVAIAVRSGGARLMRSSRGANALLSPDDVQAISSQPLDFVHLTGYALLGAHGMALLDAAAQLARTCGARLSFDPSSTGVVERFGGRQLVRCCERLRVDVLLPNRPEALALAGVKRVDAAVTLLAEFVPTVVVKDGERGCLCSVDGKPVRVRTLPIVAADSTGAGDAFDAGVLVGLSEGNDLESASRRGHEAAHQVIQYFGGRPGLP